MNTTVLVVDDEPGIGRFLKSILEEVPQVMVADVISNPIDILSLIDQYGVQVVFLDIDMPNRNGIQLARELREKYDNLSIVFATAYPDYTLEAFELYSFDYILKPFNKERIKKTMLKLRNNLEGNFRTVNTNLVLEKEGRKVILQPNEIIYIESRKHKIHIKTRNLTEIVVNGELYDFEDRLRSSGFFRCHRSFLVNIDCIRTISAVGYAYDIITKSGERVPLSRRQVKDLRKWI